MFISITFFQRIVKNKKITSAFIIFLSILISIFVISKTPSQQNKKEPSREGEGFSYQKTSPTLTFEAEPLENLTLKLANNLTKKALEKNFYQDVLERPAIVNPKDKLTIQETVNKIIDEEFNTPVVKKSDIIIGDDNSPQVQRLYVLYLNQVISDIPTFTETTDENPSLENYFLTAASNLETAIQLLKIVHVPPSWVPIHYKILTLLIHQRNIFIALTKNIDDPMRFLSALYEIKNDPFSKGLDIIRKEIEQKIKDEKLI